jgi:hypothetical protein
MRSILLLLPIAALATACSGPTCQSSCERLYGDQPATGDEPAQCNLATLFPDTEPAEMMDSCMAHCNDAVARNGEAGDYDPNQRAGAAEVSLDNERQAALWMDCVEQTSCDLLKTGVCAPTTNFPN